LHKIYSFKKGKGQCRLPKKSIILDAKPLDVSEFRLGIVLICSGEKAAGFDLMFFFRFFTLGLQLGVSVGVVFGLKVTFQAL